MFQITPEGKTLGKCENNDGCKNERNGHGCYDGTVFDTLGIIAALGSTWLVPTGEDAEELEDMDSDAGVSDIILVDYGNR